MDRDHFDNITKVIEQPDVMFDIGVATMNTEGWWASQTWKGIEIFGFEPCERRFRELYNYPGNLKKMAVTDKVGKFNGQMNNYDFKIKAEEDKNDPYIDVVVESTTIDELDSIHGPFDKIFIWADIEGGELTLLKGAEKVLKEKRVIGINLELFSTPPVEGWPVPEETIEYLKQFDYHISFGERGSYEDWDRKSQQDFLFLPKKD